MTNPTAQVDARADLRIVCTGNGPERGQTLKVCVGFAAGIRRMGFNGVAPGVIGYQPCRDGARSQVWGDTAGSAVTGVGTGAGAASTLTVHGRVPAQATPADGNYRDTVTATVEY